MSRYARFSVLLIFLAGVGCNSQQTSKSSGVSTPKTPPSAGAQASQGEKPADPTSIARVKKLAQECGEATMKGNYQRVIELTHDTVVNAMGGKEQAVALTKSAMDELARSGGGILSYQMGEPGPIHAQGQYSFSVVPSVVNVKVNNQKMRMGGYLLAISPDQGANWKFIDSNALEDPKLRRFVPPLPPTLKLPAPEEPQIVG